MRNKVPQRRGGWHLPLEFQKEIKVQATKEETFPTLKYVHKKKKKNTLNTENIYTAYIYFR